MSDPKKPTEIENGPVCVWLGGSSGLTRVNSGACGGPALVTAEELRLIAATLVEHADYHERKGRYAAEEEAVKLKLRDERCTRCGSTVKTVAGASLREARESAGLTLRDIARVLDFSVPYLSDVELERRRATPRVVDGYERAIEARS